jgi:hypothetical protein
MVLFGSQTTSNLRRHLIEKHKINLLSGADAVAKPFDDDYSLSRTSLPSDDDEPPKKKKRTPLPNPHWRRLYS